MKRLVFTLLLGIVVLTCYAQNDRLGINSVQFHYEDIENFKKVIEVYKKGGDSLEAVKTYFKNGSVGMKAWIERYQIAPERIYKAIEYFPEYYEYLSQIDIKLKTYESKIRKGLQGLAQLYPSDYVYLPPIYYFILFSGGGSVEMTANMISVDYFGYHNGLNKTEFERIGGLFPEGKLMLVHEKNIPQVVVHETAHLLQAYAQGEFDYTAIYEEKKQTILAYLIREGGADFLTYLGAGFIDTTQSEYGDIHEKQLWDAVKDRLDEHIDNIPGLFSGKSDTYPNWPFQIGYYLGFKIVQYYYETSSDKDKAIKDILGSYSKAHFERFVKVYQTKW